MKKGLTKLLLAGTAGAGLRVYFYNLEEQNSREYFSPRIRQREENLESMKKNEYDILVIGGGATGASVALEASLRGLSCALIEEGDFAGQTSSKSTKLLHGGVRYLDKAVHGKAVRENLELVSEALKERTVFMRNAPHLTSWIGLGVPSESPLQLGYFYTGLWMYHILAKLQLYFVGLGHCKIPRPSFTFEPRKVIPKLEDFYSGCVIYYDGQMNDSRLCLEILLTATSENYVKGMVPAHVANHVSFVDHIKKQGFIVGAKARNNLTGEEFEIKAKSVINCTGPFADKVRKLALESSVDRIVPGKGSHIVLPASYAPNGKGMLIPETEDGRMVFLIPWEGKTLVGTTDTKGSLSKSNFISDEEKEFLVRELFKYYAKPPSGIRDDILASFSGERPLVKQKAQETSELSRKHVIEVFTNGLISVLGGKWTIARHMGEEAVETAVSRFGLTPEYKSRSFDCLLIGGHQVNYQELAAKYGVSEELALRLYRHYGSRTEKVLQIGNFEEVVRDHPFIKSEVLYAIREEYARTPMDVIAGRLNICFINQQLAKGALIGINEVMGDELNWSKEEKQQKYKEAYRILYQYRN